MPDLPQYKSRFFLIVKKTLLFAWTPNTVREIGNLPPNLKRIVWRCFSLLHVVIRIIRSILSLNSYNSYNLPLLISKPGTFYFFLVFYFYFSKLPVKFFWCFGIRFHIRLHIYHVIKYLLIFVSKPNDIFGIIYDTYESYKSKKRLMAIMSEQ